MRWTKGPADRWSTLSFWNARYKNFKIKVSEGTTGFSNVVEYYWFSVNNEKLDIRQNSLWFEGKYESLEKAQEEAVHWIDKFLTKDNKS